MPLGHFIQGISHRSFTNERTLHITFSAFTQLSRVHTPYHIQCLYPIIQGPCSVSHSVPLPNYPGSMLRITFSAFTQLSRVHAPYHIQCLYPIIQGPYSVSHSVPLPNYPGSLLHITFSAFTQLSRVHAPYHIQCLYPIIQGLITSSQMLAYTLSKFVSGILVDSVRPKYLLSIGLFSSGLTALAFPVGNSALMFTFIWFLNGLASGPGWPACALLLKEWYMENQFGTMWSILSTSVNVAGTLGPLITAYIILTSGWKTGMVLEGLVAIFFSIVILFTIADKPTDTVEKREKAKAGTGKVSEDSGISRLSLFKLPGFLGICLSFMAISLVQYGTLQWGQLYLIQDKGQSIITGSSYLSSLEIGGIIGSIAAGYMSDFMLIRRREQPKHIVRQTVIAWFCAALVIFMCLFVFTVSHKSTKIWINAVAFGMGFCIYGSIVVFGVVAIESAPKHLGGTAHAVACVFASVGQALSGLPLSFLAKQFNWELTFILQTVIIIASTIYLFLFTGFYRTATVTDDKKKD
ncbi:hypothetical protein ACJMK2_019491 [Sinanodonta woodiana]|uniref:Major facilitator superfamily (MFS) profile domain-containing protein n=1 Tax=Sinanodonta woodiana TaxID=1069815 RepID=A0ABD3TYK7_SINWO